MVAVVAAVSRISMVEVVLNFCTARGSLPKTCRGEPMVRSRRMSECAIPVRRIAAPTAYIASGSRSTSVVAANSRIRVS
jgi:hypothetical protein